MSNGRKAAAAMHAPYRAPRLGPSGRWSLLAGPALAGAAAVAGLTAVATTWDVIPVVGRLAPTTTLRWVLLGLVGVLLAYVLSRESTYRRLASQLSDERVLAAAYSNRVRDLSALVATARTINGVLELDEVLRVLLDEALGFFQGEAGSIMMLDGAGFLQTVAAHGNENASEARLRIGDSIAGHVALTREPLLLSGTANPKRFRHLVERDDPVSSAMCVPLIHRNEMLGVLNISAADERDFSDHDLQLLTVFAGHASIAIANARVFETERNRLSELADLNRMKSELIAGISHDLKTPLTALSGGLAALQRIAVDEPDASDIMAGMHRHLERLAASVDRLLAEAEVANDGAQPGMMGSTDLADIAVTVAQDFGDGGQSVELRIDESVDVVGDPGLLQQVLWNLLDNAFKYGRPPVTISVGRWEEQGLVSVTDRGEGIAPGDRDRIFERFSRIGGTSKKGMGLGLSIVHGIVASCGGRVWADDAEGGGTVFNIALPLAAGTHGRPRVEAS